MPNLEKKERKRRKDKKNKKKLPPSFYLCVSGVPNLFWAANSLKETPAIEADVEAWSIPGAVICLKYRLDVAASAAKPEKSSTFSAKVGVVVFVLLLLLLFRDLASLLGISVNLLKGVFVAAARLGTS